MKEKLQRFITAFKMNGEVKKKTLIALAAIAIVIIAIILIICLKGQDALFLSSSPSIKAKLAPPPNSTQK